jgi:hypothetical protein
MPALITSEKIEGSLRARLEADGFKLSAERSWVRPASTFAPVEAVKKSASR